MRVVLSHCRRGMTGKALTFGERNANTLKLSHERMPEGMESTIGSSPLPLLLARIRPVEAGFAIRMSVIDRKADGMTDIGDQHPELFRILLLAR